MPLVTLSLALTSITFGCDMAFNTKERYFITLLTVTLFFLRPWRFASLCKIEKVSSLDVCVMRALASRGTRKSENKNNKKELN